MCQLYHYTTFCYNHSVELEGSEVSSLQGAGIEGLHCIYTEVSLHGVRVGVNSTLH